MSNYTGKFIGKSLMAMSAILVILVFLALLGGCANTPGKVMTAHTTINLDRVMVVPERVVESCEALPELTDGNKAGVLDWAINAHSNHGICMFRKDLSDDFLRAAATSQARVELFTPTEAKGKP